MIQPSYNHKGVRQKSKQKSRKVGMCCHSTKIIKKKEEKSFNKWNHSFYIKNLWKLIISYLTVNDEGIIERVICFPQKEILKFENYWRAFNFSSAKKTYAMKKYHFKVLNPKKKVFKMFKFFKTIWIKIHFGSV